MTPSADIQFQAEPLQRGAKYTGVGKLYDVRLKSPSISETVEICPWLLWNVNRKSYVLYSNDDIFNDLDEP